MGWPWLSKASTALARVALGSTLSAAESVGEITIGGSRVGDLLRNEGQPVEGGLDDLRPHRALVRQRGRLGDRDIAVDREPGAVAIGSLPDSG